MCRKYFSKNKGVLPRRFVASGLAAVFSAGMFGSYAGAMEPEMDPNFMPFNEKNQKDRGSRLCARADLQPLRQRICR